MAGEILAAQMTERALAIHKIPVTQMCAVDGEAITATDLPGGANFNLAANVLTLLGDEATGGTETTVFTFQYTLPPNYMAAGGCQLRLKCNNIGGAGGQTSCTITVTAYESDGNGVVGGNLESGGAQTHANKAEWFTKDFPMTATNLVAGDTLNISVSVVNIEDGSGTLNWTCDEVAMLLDIQG